MPPMSCAVASPSLVMVRVNAFDSPMYAGPALARLANETCGKAGVTVAVSDGPT